MFNVPFFVMIMMGVSAKDQSVELYKPIDGSKFYLCDESNGRASDVKGKYKKVHIAKPIKEAIDSFMNKKYKTDKPFWCDMGLYAWPLHCDLFMIKNKGMTMKFYNSMQCGQIALWIDDSIGYLYDSRDGSSVGQFIDRICSLIGCGCTWHPSGTCLDVPKDDPNVF